MARYTDSVCRHCRRENLKLFLKGDRCYSDKCAFDRRTYPPGQHGERRGRKPSDYGVQLREKQKVKRMYGLSEKQFHLFFIKADRQKGITGTNLLVMLERRLDNVVYRLGFAESRAQARQLVRHGHFAVNGRKTDIPSYQVSPGDVIAVRDSSRASTYFKDRAQAMQGTVNAPSWLNLNVADMSGSMVAEPSREDVEIPLNEQLIVEYYSR